MSFLDYRGNEIEKINNDRNYYTATETNEFEVECVNIRIRGLNWATIEIPPSLEEIPGL